MTRFLVGAALLSAGGPAWAATEKKPLSPFEESMIEDNIRVTRWFNGLAESIDLFLAGGRTTDQRNDTHVSISNSSYARSGEGVKNSTNFGVGLKLPNVENYWKLKFTSVDEHVQQRGVQEGVLRQTPQQQNYGATLGLFKKLGDISTSFEPRVELADPLKVSQSLKFQSSANLKTYRVSPQLEFYASPATGAGIYSSSNITWILSPIYTFTLITQAEYRDHSHTFYGTNGISYGQQVNLLSSLSYNLIFSSNNRDVYHLDSFGPSVTWTQILYKRVLDYQVTPRWDFESATSFRGIPGLTFSINLNF